MAASSEGSLGSMSAPGAEARLAGAAPPFCVSRRWNARAWAGSKDGCRRARRSRGSVLRPLLRLALPLLAIPCLASCRRCGPPCPAPCPPPAPSPAAGAPPAPAPAPAPPAAEPASEASPRPTPWELRLLPKGERWALAQTTLGLTDEPVVRLREAVAERDRELEGKAFIVTRLLERLPMTTAAGDGDELMTHAYADALAAADAAFDARVAHVLTPAQA